MSRSVRLLLVFAVLTAFLTGACLAENFYVQSVAFAPEDSGAHPRRTRLTLIAPETLSGGELCTTVFTRLGAAPGETGVVVRFTLTAPSGSVSKRRIKGTFELDRFDGCTPIVGVVAGTQIDAKFIFRKLGDFNPDCTVDCLRSIFSVSGEPPAAP